MIRQFKRKIRDANDQSADEVKLANFVKDKIDECRRLSSRTQNESIWMTNTAYVLGYDGIYFDSSDRQFKSTGVTDAPLRRNRLSVNKILPTLQNRLARLCKNPPRFDVRPNSGNQEDKDAARLSEQVLVYEWERQHLNKKRIPLYMWAQQAGHGYIQVSWDPSEGRRMKNPDPKALEDGQFDPSDVYMHEGDIRVEVCSPFQVFPDPMAEDIDDCQWLVKAKVRKLDYFRTRYPERGDLVKEESSWLLSTQYESQINNMTNASTAPGAAATPATNSAIELTYYERPSLKHPEGRFLVVANGVLLEDKELPIDEIPFAKFDDVVIAGKFNPESIVTHLRPLQDQHNRIVTKRNEWLNQMLAGKYLSPKGAGLGPESFDDESGEILEYDWAPGMPEPRALQTPNIPQYAYTEEDAITNMFYDIAGINEVSRGQMPAAGIPAIGMQFLMEQDDTRIGIVTEQHEHAWARVGRHILKFIAKNYEAPRLLKKAAKNQEYIIKEFVGQDLGESFDVAVVRGSTLPGSKVLKRQELLNLFGQGLLGDPSDPAVITKLLDMLEYGEIGDVWIDLALDKTKVKNNIEEIEKGIAPEVSEFDNHVIALQEMNRYRKSDKFKLLGDKEKALFMGTMEAHMEVLTMNSNPDLKADMAADKEGEMVEGEVMNDPALMEQMLQADNDSKAVEGQVADEMVQQQVTDEEQIVSQLMGGQQ